MKNNNSVSRNFQIIYAIATLEKPSLTDIHVFTAIPKSSIKRIIIQVRERFKMDLQFYRDQPELNKKLGKGKSGHYKINDWGVLNKSEFIKAYKKVCVNISTNEKVRHV